jgi:dethiobiotin synthetase
MTQRNIRGFFITGTGTGVGKTFVSRVLAQAFSNRIPVSYMKPVQTGCLRKKDGRLVAPDFEYVKKGGFCVTGKDEIHVPYRFVPACSPHLAARMANKKISLKKIKEAHNAVAGLFDDRKGCVLVEGAGGVLVPLGASISMVHLIDLLRLPVILVTTPDLGTLNHTFLSICALASCGARLAGVVMNNPANVPEDYIYRDNRKTIQSFVRPALFLEIKHTGRHTVFAMEFCNELFDRFL